MLDTFHLRTFITVVEAGNYSAAAEYLHMSQPAVSQHIHALEEHLDGVRLFRRLGKRMVPTHAGEELLVIARELIILAERAEASIKALKGQVGGQVTIGCTPSSGERLLAPILALFHERFPAVMIHVQVAPTHMLLEAFAQQQLQVLLLEDHQRRRGWEARPLCSEPLLLIAPVNHSLVQPPEVGIDAFNGQPLILPPLGSPLRRSIDETLRRRGLTLQRLNVALETESITLALQAVRAGMGLAFIPQNCLPQGDDLKVINLSGASLQHEWFVLRTRDERAPQSLTELFTFLTGPDVQPLLLDLGCTLPGEK